MAHAVSTWEFRIETDPSLDLLDEMGGQGWELVDVDERRYVFKRPALSFVERVTLEQRAHVFASIGLDVDAPR